MASCKTKFSFKARFTNVGLTRNVDVCYTFLNIKNLNYLLKRNTFACIMIKKKKKSHADNLSEYMLKMLFKTSVNKI